MDRAAQRWSAHRRADELALAGGRVNSPMAQSRQIVVALVALPAALRFDVRARIGEPHCRFVEFDSADEALAALRDAPPDLFVTFLDAPDFAAWRLCRLLRPLDPTSPRPASVVAISATLITEEARCITTELGGDCLLRWPDEAEELAAVLGRLPAPDGSAHVDPVIRRAAEAPRRCDDAERYRGLFANMLDGCALHEMIWDADGEPADYRFLAVNPAFEQMTGLQASRILGRTVLEVLPGTERHWIENYGRVARTGESYRFEGRHAGLGRDYDSLAFRAAPNQFACVFRDITERQRHARSLDRLHRLAEMLGQVNQAVARAQTQEELFADICRVSTRFGRFSLTWIGIVDDAAGTLRIHATDAASDTSPHAAGTAACDINRRALAECRPAVCNDLDLAADPGCPRTTGDASIRACAAFPLRLRGEVHGTLCVHATEVGFFETEELGMLEEVALDISFALEKLDSEKTRNELEERFRIAFEHFPTPVTLSAIESGVYLEVNRKFESTFGFSRDEAIGKTSLELGVISPRKRAQLIERLLREGRVAGADFYMTTRDGRRLDCQLNAELVTIAGRRRLQSMFVDQSDRKQAEEKLRESEALYRPVLNASPDAILITSLEGCLRIVSPASLALYGTARMGDMVGRRLSEFMVPEDWERANRNIELLLQGLVTGPAEYRALRADGSRFDIEANAEVIHAAGGQPDGLVFVVRDISERKRAEEKLRESEALYRSVLNASPDDITVTDLQGRLRMVSPAGLAMFGTDRLEDALGRSLYEFVVPEDRERAVRNLSDRLRGAGTDRSNTAPFASTAVASTSRRTPSLCVTSWAVRKASCSSSAISPSASGSRRRLPASSASPIRLSTPSPGSSSSSTKTGTMCVGIAPTKPSSPSARTRFVRPIAWIAFIPRTALRSPR